MADSFIFSLYIKDNEKKVNILTIHFTKQNDFEKGKTV